MTSALSFAISFLLIFFSPRSWAIQKTIYGPDNRYDYYKETDPLKKELAQSIFGQVSNRMLFKKGEFYYPTVQRTYGEGNRLCQKNDPFYEQQTLATCTAFLVAPSILATAGHCVVRKSDCDNSIWVKNYILENNNQTAVNKFHEKDVYHCKRILVQELDSETKSDFALIELDQEVNDIKALELSEKNENMTGEKIFIMGHPSGLPLKISDDAYIFSETPFYFSSNLDSFHGNSGSPVFNQLSLEVEGILVRGNDDFYKTTMGCQTLNICTEDGKQCLVPPTLDGEHSTKIEIVRKKLAQLNSSGIISL